MTAEVEVILCAGLDAPPARKAGFVCTWNRHPGSNNLSLLDYVEENGERLREKFLNWSSELGETEILGKSMIEHLSLGDGLSYWWMTPLMEKSPWKSSWIKDVLRLLALEEILAAKKTKKLLLITHDDRLSKVIARLCKCEGIEFEQIPPSVPDTKSAVVGCGLVKQLPLVLQGLATLARQVWIRRDFVRQGSVRWKGGKDAMTIVSYFFHLEPESETFRSRFWGNLPDIIGGLKSPVNWVHMFYPHPDVPSAKKAIAKAARFNKLATEHELHTFIDGFLSLGVLACTLRNWIRLIIISFRLAPIMHENSETSLRFWPVIEEDWNASLRGSTAVMNLLWKELFDAALTSAPSQVLGVYLWENQPWEQAWIHAWRKNGHGKLVGVAHSTIRFWDLRYFGYEKDGNLSIGKLSRPLPDTVVINGEGMREAISGTVMPFEVLECEALRFSYLQSYCEAPKTTQRQKDDMFRILVMGDYLPAETDRMLKLLALSVPILPPQISFTFKPHPNFTPDLSQYREVKMSIETDSLEEILLSYDAAFSSNITSAALDAYLAKIPVIVLYPDNDLNYSPLRNRKGVHFVNDSTGFVKAVNLVRSGLYKYDGKDYFHFDPAQKRWRNILSQHSSAAITTL